MMTGKNKTIDTFHDLPDSDIFPANTTWLASLIGIILFAFSLSIIAMLTY